MSPNDLRAQCGDSVGQITLHIKRPPRRDGTIRLMPKSGPRGYILYITAESHTVARFDCKAILRWLKRFEGEVML